MPSEKRFGVSLRVQQENMSPHSARVWLNDVEVTNGLLELRVEWAQHQVTTANLKIAVDGLEMDAETLARLTAIVEEQEGLEESHASAPSHR